nr:MAG TPA: hypothetical protein [Caudoviricetes sp.]
MQLVFVYYFFTTTMRYNVWWFSLYIGLFPFSERF